MTQKITFLVAAGVTAFVVVVLGALISYLLMGKAGNSTAFASQGDGAQSNTGQFSSPQQNLPQPPQFGDPGSGNASPGSGSQGAYPVSADQAASIALSSVPGSALSTQPRLVNFNGTVAYEVALNAGFVYIDANSGQVVYNGANGTQGRPRRRIGRPGG